MPNLDSKKQDLNLIKNFATNTKLAKLQPKKAKTEKLAS